MSTQGDLEIYLVTFNCGRELINPPAFASHFFDALADSNSTTEPAPPSSPPAIIVLNLQEIAPIAYAFLGRSFVTLYLDRFQQAVNFAAKLRFLDDENSGNEIAKYGCVCVEAVGMTAIMIFARSDLVGSIADLTTAGVGVGVQAMGNKGAAGVRMRWRINGTDSNETDSDVILTFVSAHLAPMEEKLERRIQDYKDIVRGLIFTSSSNDKASLLAAKATTDDEDHNDNEEDVPLLRPSQDITPTISSPSAESDMYSSTTHLFFAGDLNYRTSNTPPSKSGSDTSKFPTPPPSSSPSTTTSHFQPYLQKDQLTSVLTSRRSLHGLQEAPISFSPTYKYNFPPDSPDDSITEPEFIAQNSYPFASHRWPSWCDRILYSHPPSSTSSPTSPTIHNYTSLPLLRTSDHRPVALSLTIPLSPSPAHPSSPLNPHKPDSYTVDADWRANRATARRKEVVVGAGAWLALTWEGRAVVLLLVAGGLGVVALFARGG